MSKSEEYRAKVAKCERMAHQTSNERHRQLWLDMARDWRERADREEKIGAKIIYPSFGISRESSSFSLAPRAGKIPRV